jgi:hypothetical protein
MKLRSETPVQYSNSLVAHFHSLRRIDLHCDISREERNEKGALAQCSAQLPFVITAVLKP